jgi:cysteine synthase B
VRKPADHNGQLIGNTPLVRIRLPEVPEHVELYGKLEGDNPAGSVKDRPAYNMISQALERGDIDKDSRLVEATSGNTGIALAMVCASLGIDITLLMPASSTKERVDTMRAYGARVILTDADKTIEHSRELAEQMVEEEGYFMLDQFNNPDNYKAHYKGTGPEIWRDTEGRITHFVSSMGTTGTIMGTSMFLKERDPEVRIVGVQPEEGSRIPGIRKWSEEFLPKIFDPDRVDDILYVNQDQATAMARRLASECGIFAGMSSGGATHAAVELAGSLEREAVLVCILCDRGDRYLSSDLYGS